MGIQRDAVARSKHTTSRAIGDEFIVVDRRGRAAHALSGEHAQVWRELGGDHRQVVALTDAERADAVAELQALGLLSTGVGRRALLRRAGVVGGVAVGAGIASIALPHPASAKSQPVVSQTTAGTFSFTVPSGEDITRVEFTVNGAGGGGRPVGSNPFSDPGVNAGRGGSGARITGTITRSLASGGLAGLVISGYVGEGGKTAGGGGSGSTGTARGGGAGGASTFPVTPPAAAGGGGATTMLVDGSPVVIAGAGGGAGVSFFQNVTAAGGAAGANGDRANQPATSGFSGNAGSGASGGSGGANPQHGGDGSDGSNDATGGRGGNGGAGTPGNPVNSAGGGGGGGGGYGGGGGGEGSADNGCGAGGGGGSSLTASGTANGITITVNAPTTPNSGSGAGGQAYANGTDGSVSLTYRTFV